MQARKAGWALWLYDERGYPSGNAGGIVLRGHPEWEASGLLIADAATDGPSVTLAVPPGELVLAAAFPARGRAIDPAGKVDLSVQVRDGRLAWQPPPGHWHVLVVTQNRLFEGTHAETNYSAKIPYVNLLMPEPTRRFLERHPPGLCGAAGHRTWAREFMATFTDEPSLMSVFMKPMPYRVLPWAPDLPAEFQRPARLPARADHRGAGPGCGSPAGRKTPLRFLAHDRRAGVRELLRPDPGLVPRASSPIWGAPADGGKPGRARAVLWRFLPLRAPARCSQHRLPDQPAAGSALVHRPPARQRGRAGGENGGDERDLGLTPSATGRLEMRVRFARSPRRRSAAPATA